MLLLAAFAGLSADSMSRGQGWRFLEIGRHLERGAHRRDAAARVLPAGHRRTRRAVGGAARRSPTRHHLPAPLPFDAPIRAPCSTCCIDDETNPRSRAATSCCSSSALVDGLAAPSGAAPRAGRGDARARRARRSCAARAAPGRAAGRAASTPRSTPCWRACRTLLGALSDQLDTQLLQPRRPGRSSWCGSYEVPGRPHDALRVQPAGRRCATTRRTCSRARRRARRCVGRAPDGRARYRPSAPSATDFFGNRVLYFAVQEPHDVLTVTATSERRGGAAAAAGRSTRRRRGTTLRDATGRQSPTPETRLRRASSCSTRRWPPPRPSLAPSPQPSFPRRTAAPRRACPTSAGASTASSVFDPESTTVATPLVGGARAAPRRLPGLRPPRDRLPALARPAGALRQRLPGDACRRRASRACSGADASHAWFAVFVPDIGWVDFDPTNDCLPGDRHVTTAWGRDYADVTPLKGVIFGGGAHTLEVSVDMARIE